VGVVTVKTIGAVSFLLFTAFRSAAWVHRRRGGLA